MNPICNIGRYDLPLGSIVAIRRRSGWRAWFINWLIEKFDLVYQPDVYDVLLSNGEKIQFTETEKAQYDETIQWHALTLEWYGAARGLGLRT